jgi:hypothetical protein
MTTLIKRQSRFDRRNPPEVLQLSNRDIRIFLALHNHRYLRSTYLHALVGGEWTHFQARLRDLYRAKYLSRPPEQQIYANVLNRPVVYELDRKGEEVLKNMGLWTHDLKKQKTDPHHEYLHDLGLNDASCSIELGALSRDYNIRHTQHVISKSTLDGPYFPLPDKKRYVPDWLFGVEGDQGVILYCLEFDRSTMPVQERKDGNRSSYERKLKELDGIIRLGGYKQYFIPPKDAPAYSLLALHLFISGERMRNVMEIAGPSAYNLYKAVPRLGSVLEPPTRPLLDLFLEPWQRVGHEPLSMMH